MLVTATLYAFALATPSLVVAAPKFRRSALPIAGSTTIDSFATTASINTALFPNEAEVGYPGGTRTGAQPFAIETAAAFPTHTNIYPLVLPTSRASSGGDEGTSDGSSINIAQYWGNLSPQYSVPSSQYGLDSASPKAPANCSVTRVFYYYRHGARYPTAGQLPAAFATKIHNATQAGGFTATGPLQFLESWSFKLGEELLTPFGRKQNFDLGVAARVAYGNLLNNFTAAGKVPVLRSQSQDRMVKTALNFAAGFFGVPEYQTAMQLSLQLEAPGFNASGAPYETCLNANKAPGGLGTAAAANFTAEAYQATATRLQQYITGINITTTEVSAMLNLCAYETDALGYSKFCELFSDDDFKNFEHAFDLSFYYGSGFGSPVAAAQGLGYLQELYARLTQTPIPAYNSDTNSTLDANNITFPLDQALNFDAAHEVSILNAMVALNLTGLVGSNPPTIDGSDSTFVASKVVPFGTNLVIQELQCAPSSPTRQMRFIVNDAVVPLSYPGCDPTEYNGLCSYDTVLAGLAQRISEIDFNHDCLTNYTLPALGSVTDGRAPK